ncbi:MAG TPA: hypothetical protein ENK57_04710 [Polyangiaceae bacterium]|nr:hypothetical protein [Polyangiaceae bacterium]
MRDFLNPSLEASLQDLKTIYRLLLAHHAEHLVDNGFFESIRILLVEQAAAEGVDVNVEQDWLEWLEEVVEPLDADPRGLLN